MAPCDEYPVLQTVMPRCLAASRSIEALRGPVETMRRKRPSCSRVACGRGVRSRITQTTSKGNRRANDGGGVNQVVVEHGDLDPPSQDRPVGRREGDILVIVKDGDFNQRLLDIGDSLFQGFVFVWHMFLDWFTSVARP
jgi:hypothetical protein